MPSEFQKRDCIISTQPTALFNHPRPHPSPQLSPLELAVGANIPDMQTTRSTRSSVLGKRGHQQEGSVSTLPVITPCDQLQTPDPTPNPKRARTSIGVVDGDSNKENVPPYTPELINVDAPSPRGARALRRTTTELTTPARARPGMTICDRCLFSC